MYVIKYRGNYLDQFVPNDLPIRTKYGVSTKNILKFSKKSFCIYDTFEEAKKQLLYILHEIQDERNVKRYNQIHWNAEEALINVWRQMKIVQEG